MLLANRCQVCIKQEATAGTAETLAAANVILTTDLPSWDPAVEMTERNAMTASLDSRGAVVGSRMGKISFKQYIRGTAAAPTGGNQSDFAIPFIGCGLGVTYSGTTPNEIGTWAPSVTNAEDNTTGSYCTVAIYRDGKQYLLHGAVGDLSLTFEVGKPILAEYDFTGILNTPTDVALLVPTYPTVVEPPFLGAALTVQGFATAKIKSLTLKLGNSIAMRPYPNTLTGFFTAQITGRKVTFSLDPEEELAATKNWFSEWLAGTTGSIATGIFPSNGTNYNQFSLTIPKAQYMKGGYADRDGVATVPIEGIAQANSDAGEDSFSLVET